MFDITRKTLLTGIGLAAMTRDKVQELAQDLAERAKLSEKEGRDFVDDLLKKSEQARKDLEGKIEETVREVVAKLRLATKDDITELTARIASLENDRAAENE